MLDGHPCVVLGRPDAHGNQLQRAGRLWPCREPQKKRCSRKPCGAECRRARDDDLGKQAGRWQGQQPAPCLKQVKARRVVLEVLVLMKVLIVLKALQDRLKPLLVIGLRKTKPKTARALRRVNGLPVHCDVKVGQRQPMRLFWPLHKTDRGLRKAVTQPRIAPGCRIVKTIKIKVRSRAAGAQLVGFGH